MFSRKFYNERPVILWPLVLVIILQVIYVVAEVGFNASLLNLATGATEAEASLDDLEVFGRVFSGIGLGLMIFAARAGRLPLNQYATTAVVLRLVLNAAIIFPLSIYGMWNVQKWLIDDVVIANASKEQRQAARYVQYLGPAMRYGLVSIDSLSLDIQNLDRPDTKTALTLLAPGLLLNDRVVLQIARSVPDVVSKLMVMAAEGSMDESFRAFKDQSREAERLWALYQKSLNALPAKAAEAGYEPEARKVANAVTKAYLKYARKQSSHWNKIGGHVLRRVNNRYFSCKAAYDPQLGGVMRLAGACKKTSAEKWFADDREPVNQIV
ncbi:hypothetical protein [Marinobacter goseongensis]|uniref:hypothetical protein n=1 Tax=Marinobacter goseongensis TaxID=453838 RepID=UPI002002C998|nr:hypothetical protein [Marinobacter goseongensis]MCK7553323.1 hypothetical protein [Marinobacter goseongensis]